MIEINSGAYTIKALFEKEAFNPEKNDLFAFFKDGNEYAAGFKEGEYKEGDDFKPGLYIFLEIDEGPCCTGAIAGYVPNSENFTESGIEIFVRNFFDTFVQAEMTGDIEEYNDYIESLGIELTEA